MMQGKNVFKMFILIGSIYKEIHVWKWTGQTLRLLNEKKLHFPAEVS